MRKPSSKTIITILAVTAVIGTIFTYLFTKNVWLLLSFSIITLSSIVMFYMDNKEARAKSAILPFLKFNFSNSKYVEKKHAIEKDDAKIEDLVKYRLIPTMKKNGKVKDLEIEKSFTSDDFELFTLNNVNPGKEGTTTIKNTVVSTFVDSKNCRILMQKDKEGHFPVTENNKDFSNVVYKDNEAKICTDSASTVIPEETINQFKSVLNEFGDFGLVVKDGKCSMIFYENNNIYLNKESVEKIINFLDDLDEKVEGSETLDEKIEKMV